MPTFDRYRHQSDPTLISPHIQGCYPWYPLSAIAPAIAMLSQDKSPAKVGQVYRVLVEMLDQLMIEPDEVSPVHKEVVMPNSSADLHSLFQLFIHAARINYSACIDMRLGQLPVKDGRDMAVGAIAGLQYELERFIRAQGYSQDECLRADLEAYKGAIGCRLTKVYRG